MKALFRARKVMFSFARSKLLTVRVGKPPSSEEFVFSEDLVLHAEFFKRAMNGRWAESQDRSIDMPENDPDIFALYLHFLQTQQVPLSERTGQEGIGDKFRDLTRVYVLAEQLQDSRTKNSVIRSIFASTEIQNGTFSIPCSHGVALGYGGTPEDSPLRRLYVDLWTYLTPGTIADVYDTVPKEFLRDLAIRKCEQGEEKKTYAFANGVEKYLAKE
ncbi:hypothetical protein BDV95DRAFT_670057 [Massariosphaeria phaeospora]|uniref:BTB domain-containing protein n=1 Tax=Massariosphaeria phaeospora TaxID=100035 RepID=A0A7C8I2H6_9PLEO|nr:hypothetical protein BDV95DRAFT_670057 [Massariosphaeria phaeospora]